MMREMPREPRYPGRIVAGVALVRDGFSDCGEIASRKYEIPGVLRLFAIFSPKARKEKRSRGRLKKTKMGAGNDPWRRRSRRQIIQRVRNHDGIPPIFLRGLYKGDCASFRSYGGRGGGGAGIGGVGLTDEWFTACWIHV